MTAPDSRWRRQWPGGHPERRVGIGRGCQAARQGQTKANVLAMNERSPIRIDQFVYGSGIRQLGGLEVQVQLVGRAPHSFKVAAQECRVAIPRAEGLEEAEAVLKRAVEYADSQRVIRDDLTKNPDHGPPAMRSVVKPHLRLVAQVRQASPCPWPKSRHIRPRDRSRPRCRRQPENLRDRPRPESCGSRR